MSDPVFSVPFREIMDIETRAGRTAWWCGMPGECDVVDGVFAESREAAVSAAVAHLADVHGIVPAAADEGDLKVENERLKQIANLAIDSLNRLRGYPTNYAGGERFDPGSAEPPCDQPDENSPAMVAFAALRRAVDAVGPLRPTSLHAAILADELLGLGCALGGVTRDTESPDLAE